MTPEQGAWYLAAMIDGEGCVFFNKSTRNYCVQVTNTDPSILAAVERAALAVGLRPGKRVPTRRILGRRQQCFCIRLLGGREMIHDVINKVPIQSERKQATLREIVASFRDMPPRPSIQWLEEHYVASRWTAKQIAAEWSVHTRTALHWLDNAGIPRRGKREAAVMMWQKKAA